MKCLCLFTVIHEVHGDNLLSTSTIRSVVINLDGVPERLNRMHNLAAEHGFTLERIAGIDGRDPKNAELLRRHRARGAGRHRISDTDVACMLSHRLAWQKLVNSSERWLAVFEDDVHFGRRIAELLDEAWIPAGVSLIKLEAHNNRARLGLKPEASHAGRQLFPLSGTHTGAAAYIISRHAAIRMLSFTEKLVAPVDYILFDHRHALMREMLVHQIVPSAVIQDQILAAMHGRDTVLPSWMDRSELRRYGFAARVGRRLIRPFSKLRRLASPPKLPPVEYGPESPMSFE